MGTYLLKKKSYLLEVFYLQVNSKLLFTSHDTIAHIVVNDIAPMSKF